MKPGAGFAGAKTTLPLIKLRGRHVLVSVFELICTGTFRRRSYGATGCRRKVPVQMSSKTDTKTSKCNFKYDDAHDRGRGRDRDRDRLTF